MGIKKIIIKYLIDLREEKILPLSKKNWNQSGKFISMVKRRKRGLCIQRKGPYLEQSIRI